jgi:hypothetical protein
MLSVGAVREQGVIDTIRNGEFGFVKPVDRSEVIYFKVDDVIDQVISRNYICVHMFHFINI